MVVIFYINSQHYKYVDKRPYLSLVAQLNCNLAESTSVLNPLILVDKASIGDLSAVNYMYIPDFRRYYFVNGMEARPGGIAAIQGSVDVLTSNANKILGLRCQVSRNEYNYDMDLPDADIPVLVRRNITYKNFPSTVFSSNPTGRRYTLTVSGSTAIQGGN